MNMKKFNKAKIIVILSLFTLLPFNNNVKAVGVPVFDLDNAINVVRTIKQGLQQLNTLRRGFSNTLGQLKDMSSKARESVNAVTGMAEEFKNIYNQFKNLPNEFKNEVKSFISNLQSDFGYKEIYNGQAFNKIIDKLEQMSNGSNSKINTTKTAINNCSSKYNTKDGELKCKVELITNLNRYQTALNLGKKLKEEIESLNKLQSKASATKNIKESQDIQNALLVSKIKYEAVIKQIDEQKRFAEIENRNIEILLKKAETYQYIKDVKVGREANYNK